MSLCAGDLQPWWAGSATPAIGVGHRSMCAGSTGSTNARFSGVRVMSFRKGDFLKRREGNLGQLVTSFNSTFCNVICLLKCTTHPNVIPLKTM